MDTKILIGLLSVTALAVLWIFRLNKKSKDSGKEGTGELPVAHDRDPSIVPPPLKKD